MKKVIGYFCLALVIILAAPLWIPVLVFSFIGRMALEV